MNFDFTPVWDNIPTLISGTGYTLFIALFAAILSLVGGLAVALTTLYGKKVFSYPLRFFIWLFMGTPLLLQLYLLYFGLGQVGILMPAILTGILGLGVHYMAYNADIFRATIESIDSGQSEAARSLGFGRMQTLWFFIVPQAVIRALPQLGNNMIIMLKDTSVLSAIGVTELVLNAQFEIANSFRPFEFYIAIAVIYYFLNLILETSLNMFEKKIESKR
ncbi:MAG: polar amino acid transport system permease protein [Candidatus Paceibacteria bacterium]|jgi:polar amino acid transport system permease protein